MQILHVPCMGVAGEFGGWLELQKCLRSTRGLVGGRQLRGETDSGVFQGGEA